MSNISLLEPTPTLEDMPPTQDELPYDDGEPMETHQHVWQMYMLIMPLKRYWLNRQNVFVGGNMFVYFSPDQVKNYDFKGPDVFVVQDVPPRERKSWVVWLEGKGPDVVIELLSESTAHKDKTKKKQVYQDRLRVPEYFWFDPFGGELAGFSLQDGVYAPIKPDTNGNLTSQQLQLKLVRWTGIYLDIEATWLRWATPDDIILPTAQEAEDQEHQRAKDLAAKLARYQEQFGDLPE